jgi:hypothetical protein
MNKADDVALDRVLECSAFGGGMTASERVSEWVTRTWPEHGIIALNLQRWNITSKPEDYCASRFKRYLDRILTSD